jgi:hypothetical protein
MWNSINSFRDAVNLYTRIKPVNGSRVPLAKDVRPVRDRRRQWQRIEKYDDQTYFLTDGYYDWLWVKSRNATDDPDFRLERAAIVWHVEGMKEQITLLNTGRDDQTPTRWEFFDEFLPNNMEFVRKNPENHFILTGGKQYKIPRGHIPAVWRLDFAKRVGKEPPEAELYPVTFEREIGNGDEWHLITVAHSETAMRVDKDAKKELKPHSDKFYEWMMSVHHVFPSNSTGMNSVLSEINTTLGVNRSQPVERGVIANFITEVIRDEESEHQSLIAKLFIAYVKHKIWQNSFPGIHLHSLDDLEPKDVRRRWNTFINEKCGFIRKVEV